LESIENEEKEKKQKLAAAAAASTRTCGDNAGRLMSADEEEERPSPRSAAESLFVTEEE
jgi:hypothetical protein